jgi:hypothetical protein
MNLSEQYVREALNEMERTTSRPMQIHRQHWLMEHDATQRAHARSLAVWLGDRLVAAGERLRSTARTEDWRLEVGD